MAAAAAAVGELLIETMDSEQLAYKREGGDGARLKGQDDVDQDGPAAAPKPRKVSTGRTAQHEDVPLEGK
jgi:hypothetical protein